VSIVPRNSKAPVSHIPKNILTESVFSKKAFIYYDGEELSNRQKADIEESYSELGMTVEIRGIRYFMERS
jgi:hypothetical protein